MLIDSHNHLYYEQFDADREDVLARMAQAGVHGAVLIGTGEDNWEQCRELALAHPQLRYSVGLHPTTAFPCSGAELASYLDQQLRRCCELVPRPVAIGECGLDRFWQAGDPRVTWKLNPFEEQVPVFRQQLQLAAELDLAVVVHTRATNAETLDCLQSVPGTRGVLHCFGGDPGLLAFALARPGWYVSFAGNVTYPKATELHGSAREIPLKKLLVETDAPFITPVPHRGERNEPGYVRHTAQFIADLRGISLAELAEQTTRNAEELFRTKW